MKKYNLLFIPVCVLLFACTENEVAEYSADRYLYFSKSGVTDSVLFSFSNYPGTEDYKLGLEVKLIGDLLPENMEYKISVVDSATTAVADDYRLNFSPEFSRGKVADTLFVTLHNSGKLQTESVKLVIRIEANEVFQQGLTTYREARIIFNDMISCPPWWDEDMALFYLGDYSAEKYRAFIICTHVNDLTGMDPSKIRLLALQFKAEIERLGLTEKNGDPMVIPIY